MCGICGIYDQSGNPIDPNILEKMITILRHRGPDSEGQYIDVGIGLGHRRLSIIDLEGGNQPIGNEDGRIQIVFNGEIYNFIELRQELTKAGHRFRTRSDTEVIVHAYEQWGKECVKRFNGMFAFALWDSHRRELFLARDHLGIKPLYYIQICNRILFGSEIKALLQDPACPRELDVESLAELFTFRFVPSPKTLFKKIKKLPPGHWMTVSSKGKRIERFWNFAPNASDQWRKEKALIEEYQWLLEDSVRLQLRSDVPLGLFLSSGIDSGGLLAIMSNYVSGPIRTFTIGFKGGEKSNEVKDARALASQFGAKHEYMMVGPEDYLNYYERYMWDIEEPVGNETAAAFYFVSKITSQQVKVALTGQGADEPWGGYHRHVGAKLSTYYCKIPPSVIQIIANMVTKTPGRFERLKRGVLSLGERDILTRLAKIYSFFSPEMKEKLFVGPMKYYTGTNVFATKEALRRLQRDVENLDTLTQMLYIDTRSHLPDDLLMVADKTSMANSIEVRVPFLDVRLVEFIESLPSGLKLKAFTAKYLHKKALEKWLPTKIVYRKKKGFANPVEHWIRDSMRPFLEEFLLRPGSAVGNYFDQRYIRQILDQDRQGKDQLRRHIYLLLSFALWHNTFLRN